MSASHWELSPVLRMRSGYVRACWGSRCPRRDDPLGTYAVPFTDLPAAAPGLTRRVEEILSYERWWELGVSKSRIAIDVR